MTDTDKILNEKSRDTGSVILSASFIAIAAIFLAIGLTGTVDTGLTATLVSPLEGSGIQLLRSAVLSCAVDVGMILLIALFSHPVPSVITTIIIMAARGVAIGRAAAFSAVNAIPAVSVALIISYTLVTMLILIYSVFVNKTCMCKGFTTKLLCYLLVTGAAALLKLLPLLLL